MIENPSLLSTASSKFTNIKTNDQHAHIVHFYDSDDELVSSVTSFAGRALERNVGVILIATESHRQSFARALSEFGFDISSLKRSRQLVFLDAAEMLSTFVIDGVPDPVKFKKVVGGLIDEIASLYAGVNAYGEMVEILWDKGNAQGTILLEQLWNDLAKVKQFTLLCGYRNCQFTEASHGSHFSQICKEHSHVAPVGEKSSEGSLGTHARVIAELQQRERALEHEVEVRKRAEEKLQQEIAERKRIESELRKNQADLNDFFDNAVVGLHWVGPDGIILRANKAELALLGYEESEYVGHHVADFHVDSEAITEILQWLSRRQTLRDYPARLRCKDGSIKHVLIDSNVYWKGDQFRHTRCFTRDVTARKEFERKLTESQSRYQVLFDHSPLPKWIFNLETLHFADVNLAALKLYGYSKEEFLALKANDLRPAGDSPEFLGDLKDDGLKENAGIQRRFRHLKKDGTIIEVEVSALDLILDGQKNRIGAVMDVTERVAWEAKQKKLLRSLKAAKEEAEKANQLKSAFLANMSHEIRTPLGAMIGFADLLKDQSLTETERSNYTDILARNGEQLSVIINDILDLSKVEAGHLSLEFTEVDPEQVAREVVALLRVKSKEKNLALELISDEKVPSVIVSDPTRIRQVLLNLVGNAIKFTQFGSVKIKIYSGVNSRNKTFIGFEVSDTGIGISEAHRERIFEVFVQADGSMTRRFGGTGLGLALSRKLARALGGDVSVIESKEHQGSRFLFQIEDQPDHLRFKAKVQKDEKVAEIKLTENLLAGIKVLVVDDSPDNHQLLWRYLNKYGAVVDSAENGFLGFSKALVGNHDIVLMDIQMPAMDGYTATQKLREAGFRKPIIALTAHAMDEVRKKCLNIGCTDHLPKPINSTKLVQTVAKYTKVES